MLKIIIIVYTTANIESINVTNFQRDLESH